MAKIWGGGVAVQGARKVLRQAYHTCTDQARGPHLPRGSHLPPSHACCLASQEGRINNTTDLPARRRAQCFPASRNEPKSFATTVTSRSGLKPSAWHVACVDTEMTISPHNHDHSSPNHLQCNREFMPHVPMHDCEVLEQCGVRETVRHHLPRSLHLRFDRTVQTTECCQVQTVVHPTLIMIA
eukprot:1160388-Pelagomonas_calceolata.AAC.2